MTVKAHLDKMFHLFEITYKKNQNICKTIKRSYTHDFLFTRKCHMSYHRLKKHLTSADSRSHSHVTFANFKSGIRGCLYATHNHSYNSKILYRKCHIIQRNSFFIPMKFTPLKFSPFQNNPKSHCIHAHIFIFYYFLSLHDESF